MNRRTKRLQYLVACFTVCLFLISTLTSGLKEFISSIESFSETKIKIIPTFSAPIKIRGNEKLLMEWQRSYRRNGLGNQLFLYASLVGLAQRNGFQAVIPSYSLILRVVKSPSLIQVVDATVYDGLISNGSDIPQHEIHSTFCCTFFAYTDKLHHFLDRNIVLRGAFQSWKYFHPDLSEKIKNELIFRDDVTKEAKRILEQLGPAEKSSRPRIGVHIRRGDITKPHLRKFGHIPAPKSYFDKALKYMENRHPDAVFVVVSNDLPWAKMTLFGNSILFAPDNLTPETSMVLLTMMDHLILSVGTFSWWSAYLSNATDVIYFNGTPEPLSFYDVTFRAEDYYLPHWTGLS